MFFVGLVIGFVVMTMLMHPVLTLRGVGWLAASVLVVGGGLACLCGNTGNGMPCVGYGVVLVVVLALTRASV